MCQNSQEKIARGGSCVFREEKSFFRVDCVVGMEVMHRLSTGYAQSYAQGVDEVMHRLCTWLCTGYAQSYAQVVVYNF